MVKNLSIKGKLFIVGLLTISSLIGLLVYSSYQYINIINNLNINLDNSVKSIDLSRSIQVNFKTQVQEWKNILLNFKQALNGLQFFLQ